MKIFDTFTLFFNSSFFVALTTILTAYVVILIYKTQRKNYKIQAARVLITEIRIAEERITQIKNKMGDNVPSDLPSVFPTKSWKSHSHLFISDFDQDELKLINSFYDYGELIEDLAKRDNNFVWVTTEERARVTVQKIAEFSCEAMELLEPERDNYIKNKREAFSALLDKHNTPYSPVKPINVIKKLLPEIPNITTASCGAKLKKLAEL
jgi:hypothetical protein